LLAARSRSVGVEGVDLELAELASVSNRGLCIYIVALVPCSILRTSTNMAGNVQGTWMLRTLLHVLGGAEHMAKLCEHVALGSLHHFILVLSCRCKFKKEKKTLVFGSL
jgi:hypothetical protein